MPKIITYNQSYYPNVSITEIEAFFASLSLDPSILPEKSRIINIFLAPVEAPTYKKICNNISIYFKFIPNFFISLYYIPWSVSGIIISTKITNVAFMSIRVR